MGATDYGGIYGGILTTNYPPRGVLIHDQAIRFVMLPMVCRTLMTLRMLISVMASGSTPGTCSIRPFQSVVHLRSKTISKYASAGANGLFADGSVVFMNESMELVLLAAICTRNGNENTPDLQR